MNAVSPETTTDLKATAAKWLFGQPAIVVLLFAMMGMGGWYIHHEVTVGGPARVAQIKEGYRELEELHRAERAEAYERQLRIFDHLINTFEKAEERHERLLRSTNDC